MPETLRFLTLPWGTLLTAFIAGCLLSALPWKPSIAVQTGLLNTRDQQRPVNSTVTLVGFRHDLLLSTSTWRWASCSPKALKVKQRPPLTLQFLKNVQSPEKAE